MAKQQQQQQQKQQPAAQTQQQPKKVAPVHRIEKKRDNVFTTGSREMLFDRGNFIFFGIGLFLVLGGLVTMMGGHMPDPNKWEPERIYSFTRITLAPIMMVAGFIVVIVGIFKKAKTTTEVAENYYEQQ